MAYALLVTGMGREAREQLDLDLGVANWHRADGTRPLPAPAPGELEGAPAWYAGDEAESQAFLTAMGVDLAQLDRDQADPDQGG
jgi:hypothetical protein